MYNVPIEKLVDYNETKFNSLKITEDTFGDSYEYRVDYDITIKYKKLDTDNKVFDRLAAGNTFHKSDTAVKVHDKRHADVTKIMAVMKMDDADKALASYIRNNISNVKTMLQIVWDLALVDIPRAVYNDAVYNGKMEFSASRHLVDVEFDYRKPKVSTMTLKYDTNESFVVALPHAITNRDVDIVVPDMTLPELYVHVEDWLEEDYEGTVSLLKEIFKIDFETMKGAEIK